MRILPLFLLLVPVFLLSSCMTLDSRMEISSTGATHSVVDLDMSRMVSMLASFGTGNFQTPNESMKTSLPDKNLCNDSNFQKGLNEGTTKSSEELKNMTCTSLGDYKVRIEGDMDIYNKKGALFLSGVTILDLMAFGDSTPSDMKPKTSNDNLSSAEALGFSIVQTFTLPGNISYAEAGTLSGTHSIVINALDPKILSRKSLIVIVTENGKKLSRKEINTYKLLLRKHNRSVKK